MAWKSPVDRCRGGRCGMGREWRSGKGFSMLVPLLLEIGNLLVFCIWEKFGNVWIWGKASILHEKYVLIKYNDHCRIKFLHKGILYLQERTEHGIARTPVGFNISPLWTKDSLLARSHAGFPRLWKDVGSSCEEGSVWWSAVKTHLAHLTSGADNFSHSCPPNDQIISSKNHVTSTYYFLDWFL